MTLVWFVIWLIANNIDGGEPPQLDPVDAWTATLIPAIALDLAGAHARRELAGPEQAGGRTTDG